MSSSSSSSNRNEEDHDINLISHNNAQHNQPNNNNTNNQDNYILLSFRNGNNGEETTFIINNSSSNSNQNDTIPILHFTRPPYSLSAILLCLLFTFLYLSSPIDPPSTTLSITLWSISQKHQYFALFTSNFVHSNFPQLLYNTVFLLLTFSLCERHIGTISSWLLFISFIIINSVFYYCYKLILDYLNYYSYEAIDIGLTPIIFMYFTFIQNITKSYNLFVWGFICYVILIVLKYIYSPFNVLVGVCAGWLCLLLNKRFVLLPKKDWLCTFEQLCKIEYDVTAFQGCLIVFYCFSKRDKSISDKYY